MNNRFLDGRWPQGIGIVFTAALLFIVAANAALNGTDKPARGAGKNDTEVTRLVTGDPARINAVVAGDPPTAILAINPVQPPAAATPVNYYPAGCTIVGQELRCDRNDDAGFRAWFNAQLSGWDPAGNGPNAIAYQFGLDCSGYYQSDCLDLNTTPGDGLDLAPAIVECPGNDPTTCRVAFGESFAKCTGGLCNAGYVDADGTGRPDSFCSAPEGCIISGAPIGTCNYKYYAVSGSTLGTADGGFVYHGGTLVLDIPTGAKGKYTVQLNMDGTFIASPGTPPIEIQTLRESGFMVNLVTGSCCFGLSTPDAGCVDDCITRSDCNALPEPRVFTPGAACANPPTDDDCRIPGTGACCDMSLPDVECRSNVMPDDCDTSNPQIRWYKDQLCVEGGGTVDCLLRGACCDRRTADPILRCRDGMPESLCIIDDPTQVSWTQETLCENLDPACTEHTGACCDRRIVDDTLRCRDDVAESECVIDDPDQVSWHKSVRCSDLPEPCQEHTGACCDESTFGDCADDVRASLCNCKKCVFHKDLLCAEIECSPTPIPTVSEWGLAVLTLLLLTGAKVLFPRKASSA